MVSPAPRPAERPAPALLKDIHPELRTMIRELSERRFRDISKRQDQRLRDAPAPDDFIYGAHLTVIQLAAKELRLTFKTHFDIDEVLILTPKKAQLLRSYEEQLKSAADLFKEYSNLIAGGIAQQLHLSGIVAGISLPIATSGFNEIISSDDPRPQSCSDYWEISGEGFRFTCTLFVEIFETEALSRYTFEPQRLDSDEGSIEIL